MLYNVIVEFQDSLISTWRKIRRPIVSRLREFRIVGKNASDAELFHELVFCLFTPQSKARSCWQAVTELKREGLLMKADSTALARRIKGVRFHNNKARYVVEARQHLSINNRLAIRKILSSLPDAYSAREWLAANIKGLGYKEASHFLRNIGRSGDLAILDRHILKNIKRAGVISSIPSTITPARYVSIEKKMKEFSKNIGIPMQHLDLLLWYREAGEIFK